MNRGARLALMLILGMAAACSKEQEPTPSGTSPLDESVSFAALNRGAGLFQEHCAQCHGPEAQGHPDWQTPGVVAAPPLNGTGNDWKRSRTELMATIKNGAKRDGTLVMPAWKDRLSDADIQEIVAWFQALWPADVYARWRRANGAPSG